MVKQYFNDLKNEFSGYNTKKFGLDLMAGLTVTAVALPLALAFGVSSGASAAAGLVTAIIAGIVMSLFAGASYQISGPTGAMSAILITLVAKYKLQGMFIACFIAGVFLLVAGILKLGRIVSFIPMPVVTGFTSGIAIIIALGQIDNFFGTVSKGDNAVAKLMSYGSLGFKPNFQAVIIGLIVVAIMILWPKKWNAKVPSSLVGIIVAATISISFNFDLKTVGDIPRTLFLDERMGFSGINVDMITGLISPAFAIALLGMIESLLCGVSASRMKKENFDADRELVAQGIGNMIVPLFGGVPATAAIARTSVAIKSGCQTRLTGVIHSVGLLASMFLLGPVMAKLPLSALAGVLIMTAWRMNEWGNIKYIFSKKFKSAIAKFLITMVATVIFDLTIAIMLGVVAALIIFVAKSSDLQLEVSKVDENRLPASEQHLAKTNKDTKVVYITGAIFFANTKTLMGTLKQLSDCHKAVFSMRGCAFMDVSGVQTLTELCQALKKNDVKVVFCGVQPNVKMIMDRSGLVDAIGEDSFYSNAIEAL